MTKTADQNNALDLLHKLVDTDRNYYSVEHSTIEFELAILQGKKSWRFRHRTNMFAADFAWLVWNVKLYLRKVVTWKTIGRSFHLNSWCVVSLQDFPTTFDSWCQPPRFSFNISLIVNRLLRLLIAIVLDETCSFFFKTSWHSVDYDRLISSAISNI
jgi:hypothetical protein